MSCSGVIYSLASIYCCQLMVVASGAPALSCAFSSCSFITSDSIYAAMGNLAIGSVSVITAGDFPCFVNSKISMFPDAETLIALKLHKL